MNHNISKKDIRRLASYALRFRALLFLGIFLLVLSVLFGILSPFLIKYIFDTELPKSPLELRNILILSASFLLSEIAGISLKYIIALDQGTTSSRAIIFDKGQHIVSLSQKEFMQIYPKEGWVEHNPMEIWASQYAVLHEAMAKRNIAFEDIAGIGITNQRETVIVWDKESGEPIYNAIVWQCKRTAKRCEALRKIEGFEAYVRENTGLRIDPYFSASKLEWILENVEGAAQKAREGKLLFGTVDTWLVWKLSGGRLHITDYTNASRTMLYNIRSLEWDAKILDTLGIPSSMLPQVRNSSEVYGYCNIASESGGALQIPIAGIAGDQQAALFGQACFADGDVKNTYGTGCFMLMNTGKQMVRSRNGLLSTIAVGIDGQVDYALEGSVFVAGAAVQWIRDELKIVHDSKDTEYFAQSVENSGGVYFVPAFVGLGAPYWDMYARGAIVGLTRGTNRNHIIRAALESIAYQTKDVLRAMEEDTGLHIKDLKVDGGASKNNFLMQFQADLLQTKVLRPLISESTALGAAFLAGLALGFWQDKKEILSSRQAEHSFSPLREKAEMDALYKGWQKAVTKAQSWEDE